MKQHLLTTLENSRTYTLRIVEAMPPSGYESRPADGMWNFRELLSHMAYGIQWWESNFIRDVKSEWNPPAPSKSVSEAIKSINAAYDALKNTIDHAKADENLARGFHATLDHITHHRGQLTVHLRQQGVTPPDYMY